MDISDERPSKNFENRTKTLMDVVRERLGFPDPPGPLSERVKLQQMREAANKRLDQYGYGVPVEVGGMWGNKPTLINGREVFNSQYPRFETRTPYSAESVATSVERYLNPDNPRVVPDDQTWSRKWGTNAR